jgi:hypothetical protein
VNNNFQIRADRKMSLTTSFSSGNVWLLYVKSYNSLNEEDRISMGNLLRQKRELRYNFTDSPSKTREFHADGVIREYQIKFTLPLSLVGHP